VRLHFNHGGAVMDLLIHALNRHAARHHGITRAREVARLVARAQRAVERHRPRHTPGEQAPLGSARAQQLRSEA
jgi:hypothetical protein